MASFALAVYQRDFERAEKIYDNLGGALVSRWTEQVVADLAFAYARAGDAEASEFLLGIADPEAVLDFALEGGSAHPAELAREIGHRLARLTSEPEAWYERLAEPGEAASG